MDRDNIEVTEQNPYYDAKIVTEPQNAPKINNKKGFGIRLLALALCFSLLGGIVGAVGVFFGGRYLTSNPTSSTLLVGQREPVELDLTAIKSDEIMTAAEVYAKNVKSTVGITTSITTNFWGYQTTSAASGSGFIITSDGYILTNYHVIDNANEITVTLYDGTSYSAELIGYDASNDIAVLKADASDLTPVVLGNSDLLNVGDTVLAIGNPLGELTFSLTQGIISALDRKVTLSNGTSMDLLQTDCAINSGNSGGALFNLYGEVIGVTNAKYSSSGVSCGASIDNIGFAIPINQIQVIVENIIEKGYIPKPYIGISIVAVNEEMQSYGLPRGVAVRAVADDGPAKAAGIQGNDIITKIDGIDISSNEDLIDIVNSKEAGDKLSITLYRQGDILEVTLTIEERNQSALEQPAESQSNSQQSHQDGNNVFPWFGWGN